MVNVIGDAVSMLFHFTLYVICLVGTVFLFSLIF